MAQEPSPFTPGQPASLDLFEGRKRMLSEIGQAIEQAVRRDSVEILYLEGSPGIGKTSLFKAIAGHRAVDVGGNRGAFPVYVTLGDVAETGVAIKQILEKLMRQADQDSNLWDAVRGVLGANIREIGIAGLHVGLDFDERDLEYIGDNFHTVLSQIRAETEGEVQGFVICLDNIQRLAREESFARFLKSFVDEAGVSQNECPVLLLLLGSPASRRELLKTEPGLGKSIRPLTLAPLSPEEARLFYERAFGCLDIEVNPEALDVLVGRSSGYPLLMHEIGEAALEFRSGDDVGLRAARAACVLAADRIGRKLVPGDLRRAMREEWYRPAVEIFHESQLGKSFRLSEIVEEADDDLRNRLQELVLRLNETGVLTKEVAPGAYRFQNGLLYFYVRMEAARICSELGNLWPTPPSPMWEGSTEPPLPEDIDEQVIEKLRATMKDEDATGDRKVLKVSLSIDQHMKLLASKLKRGDAISETVNKALSSYLSGTPEHGTGGRAEDEDHGFQEDPSSLDNQSSSDKSGGTHVRPDEAGEENEDVPKPSLQEADLGVSIREQKKDLSVHKSITVRLPTRQHIKLHSLKLFTDNNISETVEIALDEFFKRQEDEVSSKAGEAAPEE